MSCRFMALCHSDFSAGAYRQVFCTLKMFIKYFKILTYR